MFISKTNNQKTHLTALPPWVQQEIEETAILNDPRLLAFLGEETIQKIRDHVPGFEIQRNNNQDGTFKYTVLAEEFKVQISITYLPISMPGPAKFEFTFSHPEKTQ